MPDPQRASGLPDGWEVVSDTTKTAAPPAEPSAGYWEHRGMAGDVWHPADRRNSSSDVGRVDNSVAGMPPEFAAISAAAVARAAAVPAANLMGRARAALGAVGLQASPVIKYEVTKSALEALGVHPGIAMGVAYVVSGYRRGAKGVAEPSAPSRVPPPGIEPHMPNVSGTAPGFGESAAGVPTGRVPVETHMPNISSGEPPAYGPPANVPPRPWGSGVPTAPEPIIDPHMPNVGTPTQAYAPSAAAVQPPHPPVEVDRYMPNVSTPAPTPPAEIPSAPRTTGSTAAAELAKRLGLPNEVAQVDALVKRGNSVAASVKAIAGNDPKKFGPLMTDYLKSKQAAQ